MCIRDRYLCAGINHMAFYQEFKKLSTGEDLYPKLKEFGNEVLNDKKTSSRTKKLEDSQKYLHEKVRYEILNRLGYFVTESSEHFAEYVPWFIKPGRKDLIDKYKIPIDEYIDRCRFYEGFWKLFLCFLLRLLLFLHHLLLLLLSKFLFRKSRRYLCHQTLVQLHR